jgi:hypothetical protein
VGRPPKSDGQYSEAYLALKRYRARKKNEVGCRDVDRVGVTGMARE